MTNYLNLDAYIEDKVKEIIDKGFVIEHSVKFSSFTPTSLGEQCLYWCNIYLKINEAKYIMEKLISCYDISEFLSNIPITSNYRIYHKIEFV